MKVNGEPFPGNILENSGGILLNFMGNSGEMFGKILGNVEEILGNFMAVGSVRHLGWEEKTLWPHMTGDTTGG